MASVMLIALAASRSHVLSECIPANAVNTGSNLTRLFLKWIRVPEDEVSPSVLQSIKLIEVTVHLLAEEIEVD
jgi:hypothetical protein